MGRTIAERLSPDGVTVANYARCRRAKSLVEMIESTSGYAAAITLDGPLDQLKEALSDEVLLTTSAIVGSIDAHDPQLRSRGPHADRPRSVVESARLAAEMIGCGCGKFGSVHAIPNCHDSSYYRCGFGAGCFKGRGAPGKPTGAGVTHRSYRSGVLHRHLPGQSAGRGDEAQPRRGTASEG
jgi:hypothetical protein